MIGPGRNSNSWVFWLKIDRPVTSEGSRSGVNWIRRKRAAEAARDRLREHGLAGAGHVLDQEVAAAEQGDEGQLDLGVLADDHSFDVRDNPVAGFLDLGHGAGPLLRAAERPTPRARLRSFRHGTAVVGELPNSTTDRADRFVTARIGRIAGALVARGGPGRRVGAPRLLAPDQGERADPGCHERPEGGHRGKEHLAAGEGGGRPSRRTAPPPRARSGRGRAARPAAVGRAAPSRAADGSPPAESPGGDGRAAWPAACVHRACPAKYARSIAPPRGEARRAPPPGLLDDDGDRDRSGSRRARSR